MRSITGNVRRATRDIDFDFIKYSIDEASIQDFIEKLNYLEGLTIKAEGPILCHGSNQISDLRTVSARS